MNSRAFLSFPALVLLLLIPTACGSSPGAAGDGGTGSDAGAVDGGICNGMSCDDDEMCLDNSCVAACEDVGQLCGAESESCCTAEQACLQDSCVSLGADCIFTEDCEIGEICEPTLGRCIPRDAVEVCEFVPPPGMLAPEVACRWVPSVMDVNPAMEEVVMTPSVMNMTDDNGDGLTNSLDIPDLVFTSFDKAANGCCTTNGVIRVVNGACNMDGTMTTIATIGTNIDNSGGIALGNLHPATELGERAPEIVATMRVGAVAFRRTANDGSTWEELWRNDTLPSADHTRGGAQPSLADLDGDGRPEVIIGNLVLDGLTGQKIWDGRETVGTAAGVGNNAFLGPVSTVADINLDGMPEVIAGNTAYDGVTGAAIWSFAFPGNNTDCSGSLACDGYNAIGNFDADPEAEVVIVRSGEVFVLEHDGTQKHQVLLPRDNCPNNESGPPTVADFDGDGRVEIGTAGADYYIVVDFDCTGDPLPAGCDSENVLWKVANQDCSSRATGSSVFDFDGDGAAEVVYADETSFRVFDGRNGNVIYEDTTHRSNTRLEMPIVVDVDNDGKSEIVVPEPNNGDPNAGGIEIWQDAANNWVRTRRVWNQHSYHVTNISEDGQVPTTEVANWNASRLNNFRQNVQPDGLFDAADLQVALMATTCQSTPQQELEVTVTNQGALGVASGIDVFVQVFDLNNTLIESGVVQTTIPLLPGQSEVIFFQFNSPEDNVRISATVDSDGAGGSQYNECIEDNNDDNTDFEACGGID